jgi:hypothetical protein
MSALWLIAVLLDPGSSPGVTGCFVIPDLIRDPAEFQSLLQMQHAAVNGWDNTRLQGFRSAPAPGA